MTFYGDIRPGEYLGQHLITIDTIEAEDYCYYCGSGSDPTGYKVNILVVGPLNPSGMYLGPVYRNDYCRDALHASLEKTFETWDEAKTYRWQLEDLFGIERSKYVNNDAANEGREEPLPPLDVSLDVSDPCVGVQADDTPRTTP